MVNGQWVATDDGSNEQLLALNTESPAPQNTSAGGTNTGSNNTSSQLTDKQQPGTVKTATEPEQPSQAQLAYEQAQRERDAVNEQNITSLRDLVDTYKPETPEEKEKRERFERTRNGIAALSSMGAALGNLFTAAGSRDGRAVSTPNLSEPAAQATERDRKIREQRDAKGIELRNRYLAMRQNMADQKVKDTWTAWQAERADKQAKAKLEADNKKFEAEQQYKNNQLLLRAKEAADKKSYQEKMIGLKKAANDIAQQNKKYSNGGRTTLVRIPINGSTQAIEINAEVLKDPEVIGAIRSLLPQDYKNKVDAIIESIGSSGAGYNSAMEEYRRIVGEFLNRGIQDGDSDEYKSAYGKLVDAYKAAGGNIVDLNPNANTGGKKESVGNFGGGNNKQKKGFSWAGDTESDRTDPKYHYQNLPGVQK